jgi:hypothetical protein
MDNPEFHSLPLHSSQPSTMIPPPQETTPVTEFTLTPDTMDQSPSVLSSSQIYILQPTTSSPSQVFETISSLAVTSAESLQTSNPSQLQRGSTPVNSVINGSVVNKNRGSSSRTTYSRSSRFSHTSRRGRSDGAGNSEDTIIQVRSEQARAKAEAKAKAKAAEAEQNHFQKVQVQQLLIKRRNMDPKRYSKAGKWKGCMDQCISSEKNPLTKSIGPLL